MFRWLLFMAAAAWAAGSMAQPTADLKLCAGDSGTADERIAACTRAIKTGRLSTTDLVATYYNRGIEQRRKGDYDLAIADYTEAIRLNPREHAAYNSRGNAWHSKRDYDRAIADYDEALRLNPKYAMAYYNRGNTFSDKRDYDRAINDYTEAIRINPAYTSALNNRGNAWRAKREYDRALADYDEAIRLDPKDAVPYFNRGLVWRAKRDNTRALAEYSEAIRLNPKYASAYNNRANVWSDRREYSHAITDYNEAIRLDPKNINAHANLAWLLATSSTPALRNPARALELAQKAAELTSFEDGDKLDTLAAALAATGNFPEAVRRQEEALAFPEFEKSQGKVARKRLELYRQGRPYIASP